MVINFIPVYISNMGVVDFIRSNYIVIVGSLIVLALTIVGFVIFAKNVSEGLKIKGQNNSDWESSRAEGVVPSRNTGGLWKWVFGTGR